jgi:hypothetical protein
VLDAALKTLAQQPFGPLPADPGRAGLHLLRRVQLLRRPLPPRLRATPGAPAEHHAGVHQVPVEHEQAVAALARPTVALIPPPGAGRAAPARPAPSVPGTPPPAGRRRWGRRGRGLRGRLVAPGAERPAQRQGHTRPSCSSPPKSRTKRVAWSATRPLSACRPSPARTAACDDRVLPV